MIEFIKKEMGTSVAIYPTSIRWDGEKIERDKRIWTNVSSFQEFETPITFDYAVTSLPANVLIDNSGKVIAKNLHGNDLKAAVEKLFSKEKFSPKTTSLK